MDAKINFSSYSLDELYTCAESIDRDLYPQRAKEIDDIIRQKETECPEEINKTKQAGDKASKFDRLVASLIDLAIAVISLIPIFYFVGLDAFTEPTITFIGAVFFYGLLTTLIFHGYLLYYYGQTIGKHYMSIRIENLDGSKATLSTIYLKRMLPMQLIGFVPSVGQFISGIVNPLFIFGKQRRCLHDYVAKTKVSYTDT
ncbi:RDD family protein [Cognaticolwellia beringensis]|uniref:RDD family protein n=1 Tax=Cognaticolwellia beringensis TaxID=1967665 RepID=A0A222G5X9_9GAMM|nr:RDD family protein [Cognaticolwellia beringensis]ASP47327.1 RDD family protein [Cognaticolwellia beringensis]